MKQRSIPFNLLSLLMIFVLASCGKGSETQLELPVVITNDVIIDPTSTAAWTGGLVTNQTTVVSEFGVCYSATNQTPTTADSKLSEPLNAYSFVSNLKNLAPNTTYYVRAYATNTTGTAYGNVVQFKTGTGMSNAYGTVSTFAGSAEGNADGTGTAALFNHPFGTVMDGAGNLYVSDSYNCTIRKITADGKVTTIAGTGSLGSADGTGNKASFYSPAGLALDANGNIFVADMGNNLIRKVTPEGVVTTFAGNGAAGYANGTGTAASFSAPSGIVIAADGSIYVSDSGTGLIRKITSSGVVTTIAGNRTAGYKNAVGTDAAFNKPAGLALDVTGNIYVAEPQNKAIRKISLDNTVSTFVGGLDSAAMVIGTPQAVAVDANSNIYFTDGTGRVMKIGKDHILTTMAGKTGITGTADGAGGAATFNYPKGILADNGGSIYITDFNNNRIRKVTQSAN